MASAQSNTDKAPLVSVLMANFEAGDKIVPALRSVLRQTMTDLEIIVSDDGSRDHSVAHVERLMAQDHRVRLLINGANGGPAACRNRALEAARGEWVAVVDSDDIIHPERFERLLAAARRGGADIIADDMILFYEDGTPPSLMLGEAVEAAFAVSTERWIRAGSDGTPALGYLKPLMRRDRVADARYDEALRIGEDYDFVLRLLLDGARMLVVPEPFYLYRRHSGSVSHRLSVTHMEAMVARQHAVVVAHEPLTPALRAAFDARLRDLNAGLAYERLVEAVKGRRPANALALLLANPAHAARLWTSFKEGRGRREPEPQRVVSPLLLLGSGETPGVTNAVPDYLPMEADWTASPSRAFWRDLAAQRGIGAVRCMPLDRAGWYASGFIPEAEVAMPELAGATP